MSRGEMLAEQAEALSSGTATNDRLLEMSQKHIAVVSSLVDYVKKLIDLHLEMKGQLEMLSADTSPYALPKLPDFPEFQ